MIYNWIPKQEDFIPFCALTGIDWFDCYEDLVGFLEEESQQIAKGGKHVTLLSISVGYVLAETQRRFGTSQPSKQQVQAVIQCPLGDIEADILRLKM